MEFKHYSVMLKECMEGLALRPDGIYIDGTAGGAGHSSRIAQKLTTGHLYGIDRDADAIAAATERPSPLAPQRETKRTAVTACTTR